MTNRIINTVRRALGPDPMKTGVICINWGVWATDQNVQLAPITAGAPALRTYSHGEIDLEFAPLLMVDYLVMDAQSFERILSENRSPHLKRLQSTLTALHGEGYIQLTDYSSILTRHRDKILSASEEHVHNPERWVSAVRRTIEAWEKNRMVFEEIMPAPDQKELLHIPYGILVQLQASGREFTEQNYQQIRQVLFSTNKRRTRLNTEIVVGCLRPYLHHVFSAIAIRNELELPVVDWEHLRNLYTPLHDQLTTPKTRSEREQDKLREFFSVVVPDYEPSSCQQLLMLLKDKRVSGFRSLISAAVKSHYAFSPSDFQRAVRAMREIDVKKASVGRSLTAIGLAVGATLTAVGADPGASIITAATMTGGQEFAQKSVAHYIEQKQDWLYMLVDATNTSVVLDKRQ